MAGVTGKSIKPVMDNYVPAKELAQQAATQSPAIATTEAIAAIRDQVLIKYESSQVGHLLSKYHTNRDKQMQTLTGLGKDVILSLLSQGIPSATLAQSLEIANDTFKEYIRITCTKEEIAEYKANAADALVAEGLRKLHEAEDKEDLAIAKAINEANMKLAKTMSKDYVEHKPLTTAVQVNNYGEGEVEQGFVKIPQMTVPIVEDLPELQEHAYKSQAEKNKVFEPDGIVDGEFTFYEGDD